jgi:hypothetical protein
VAASRCARQRARTRPLAQTIRPHSASATNARHTSTSSVRSGTTSGVKSGPFIPHPPSPAKQPGRTLSSNVRGCVHAQQHASGRAEHHGHRVTRRRCGMRANNGLPASLPCGDPTRDAAPHGPAPLLGASGCQAGRHRGKGAARPSKERLRRPLTRRRPSKARGQRRPPVGEEQRPRPAGGRHGPGRGRAGRAGGRVAAWQGCPCPDCDTRPPLRWTAAELGPALPQGRRSTWAAGPDAGRGDRHGIDERRAAC